MCILIISSFPLCQSGTFVARPAIIDMILFPRDPLLKRNFDTDPYCLYSPNKLAKVRGCSRSVRKSNYIRHNVQVAWKQLTWGTPTLQALIQRFSWTNQVGTATNISQFTVSFIPLVSCLPKTFRSMRDCSACKSNLKGRAALGRLPAPG